MIDLARTSGLPVIFENDRLLLTKDLISSPVQTRKVEEIRDWLLEKDTLTDVKDIYLVYRGLCFKDDESLFKDNHLRYDVTIILPGLLGKEFTKTVGHHHPIKKIENRSANWRTKFEISYSEIYDVLFGTGYFLLQKINERSDEIEEIYLIKASEGQKVIVPPGFGHLTINPTNQPLIVADIFNDDVKPIYDYFKNHHGAGYYLLKTEDKKLKTEKNVNYQRVSELKIGEPLEISELNINFKKPLYLIFKENPKNLEFLNSPEKFQDILIPKKLFKF